MAERIYDPELAHMVPLLPTETDWSDLSAARAQMEEMIRGVSAGAAPPTDVVFADRAIPGASGDPDVTVRVYEPVAERGAQLRPGVIYIHGGGFAFGSLDSEHQGAIVATRETGAVIVSVDYRLAPEDPFPAGIEDCYAALVWLAGEAETLGVDPERVAIMGQSAGGGLAAGLALMARDRGGPDICFQILGMPELDHRLETHSMTHFVDTPLWNRPSAIQSWRCYLGDEPGEVSPYASPSLAEDLSGLPPAFVTAMEFDPLRDEGIAYALRMMQANVPVELHAYPGTFHGSALVTDAAVSKRGHRDLIDALVRGLQKR